MSAHHTRHPSVKWASAELSERGLNIDPSDIVLATSPQWIRPRRTPGHRARETPTPRHLPTSARAYLRQIVRGNRIPYGCPLQQGAVIRYARGMDSRTDRNVPSVDGERVTEVPTASEISGRAGIQGCGAVGKGYSLWGLAQPPHRARRMDQGFWSASSAHEARGIAVGMRGRSESGSSGGVWGDARSQGVSRIRGTQAHSPKWGGRRRGR